MLYVILTLSLLFNVVVFYFDIIPVFRPIIKNKFSSKTIKKKRSIEEIEDVVVKTSLEMVKKKKFLMIWQEPKNIGERIHNFIFTQRKVNIEYFNFPRAFLYLGLVKYLKKHNKIDLLDVFKIDFDMICDTKGNPCFKLEKVDQVMFGATSLEFYGVYRDERYLKFAENVFSFVLNIYNENNKIIKYRPNSEYILSDTLGMIMPFLVEYYKETKDEKALQIAKDQMSLYIHLGVDPKTYMPVHGVHLRTEIKLGSANWGRGIGWYLLGLCALYEYDQSFAKEYTAIINGLQKVRLSKTSWSQFIGSSQIFDASSTTMFLSCMPKNYTTTAEILLSMDQYITKEGFVDYSSGDTYGLNAYSKTFGKSELSQGLLLYALSKHS